MGTPKDNSRSRSPLEDRDHNAADRDRTSDAHDETALARDARADARDARAETRERERGGAHPDTNPASDRVAAKRDRRGSGGDRKHVEHDRDAASEDRVHSARERSALLIDVLTGVHLRGPGLLELEREVTKAHRTGKPFVLAFVDVDGLKALNDSRGHGTGDQLLRHVVDTIRGVVREYDLIVRYGGDEFLCGLAGLGLPEATRRFKVANASLSVTQEASVTVGLAALVPDETLNDLIARADAAMYAERNKVAGP